jgi:O-antigen/teichoic acid export membrane protein
MSLKEQAVGGVKWNGVGTATVALLQMLKLFIVARFISKSDFGLLALATMVLGFTEIFANMGLATGLIHKQDISRKQYSSVFWLNLILSCIVYAILCAATPLVATYYHEPELNKIIPLIGLQLIISSFGKMFFTFKSKELDFKFISIVSIVSTLLGAAVTVFLAVKGLGVYSIVYGTLLQVVVMQGTYAVSGLRTYRIMFHFKPSEITDLFKIGSYQLGMQVIDYMAAKADIFLIGRFFGQELLGVYNLAKELVMKVVQVINPMITSVAAPAFAKFQDDKERMRISYKKILSILSFLNVPVFAILFVFADPLTLLCYGQDKLAVAWFVRVLSLWGFFQSIGNPASILMVSLGRTDLGFYWTLIRVVFTFAATYVACLYNIQLLAYVQVALAAVFMVAYWRMMVYKMIQLPLRQYLGAIAFSFVAAILAAGLSAFPLHFLDNFYLRLALIALFGIVYLAIYWFFNRPFIMELKGYIFQQHIK